MLNAKYLAGIFLVVLAATIGWFILGATIFARSELTDTAERDALGSLWGSALGQLEPSFTAVFRGRKAPPPQSVPLQASRIDADLKLDLRRKGLRWYPTYTVAFNARYRVTNPNPRAALQMVFSLPSVNGTYDDLGVAVDGRPLAVNAESGKLIADIPARPGHPVEVTVHYRSRGLGTWRYDFGSGVVTARDVVLTARTNFKAIDFPAGTLAPTAEREIPGGWQLTWAYRELVTGAGIGGMTFPVPLQPGPLAQRITFWAPLSLAFYVFVMLVITTLRRIELHPINYLFLAAAAFFAFHLLFAYTVDRIPVEYAFAICAVVSMALTISYLRLVAGLRFAAVEAALAQFFYLILFSYALFDEGYSGVSITIGAIVTLFVMMQLTGRIRWSERFAKA
jgi:Inner membrane protein CreD